MLNQFTWQQFLIAALIFSLLWLLIVLVLFYRKELFAFISKKPKDEVEPLTHAWQNDYEPAPDEGLLGKSALPEGVYIVEQDEFGFKQPELDTGTNDELLQADVFDLMERVKPFLGDASLDKGDFIGLVNEQVRDYHRLLESTLLDSFYELLAEQVDDSVYLDFEISAAEFRDLL